MVVLAKKSRVTLGTRVTCRALTFFQFHRFTSVNYRTRCNGISLNYARFVLPSYQLSETPVTPALKTVGMTSCFIQQRTRGCKKLLNASFSVKFFKSIFHLRRCPLSTNHVVKDILIRPGQKLFIELSLLSGYSWPIPLQDIQIDRHNSNTPKFSLSRYFFWLKKWSWT